MSSWKCSRCEEHGDADNEILAREAFFIHYMTVHWRKHAD